jgi:hypothetical protein
LLNVFARWRSVASTAAARKRRLLTRCLDRLAARQPLMRAVWRKWMKMVLNAQFREQVNHLFSWIAAPDSTNRVSRTSTYPVQFVTSISNAATSTANVASPSMMQQSSSHSYTQNANNLSSASSSSVLNRSYGYASSPSAAVAPATAYDASSASVMNISAVHPANINNNYSHLNTSYATTSPQRHYT